MNRTLSLGVSCALFATIACTQDDHSFIMVHTDILCDVPRVYQMRVTITNSGSSDQKFIPEKMGPELGFPSSFSLALPEYRTGYFEVVLEALDRDLQLVGDAYGYGTIKEGNRTDINLTLAKVAFICGNGVREGSEACDDGNRLSGDGCSYLCQKESPVPAGDASSGMGPSLVPTLDASPSEIKTLAPVASLTTGAKNTCAIRADSSLWCWGDGSLGQLRTDRFSQRFSPYNTGGTAWNQVSCGQNHCCATRTDGTLTCWGNGESGQLGNGNFSSKESTVEGHPWQAVAAGMYHTCALKQDQSVWCWGDSTNGELGNGSTSQNPKPTQVPVEATIDLASGYQHSCALASDTTAHCWGVNTTFQLGDATASFPTRPVTVPMFDFAALITGQYHTCGLQKDGSLWCWGGNTHGQLGSPSLAPGPEAKISNPLRIEGRLFRQVSAGQAHTCAVATDQTLWCWGNNAFGQLGDDTLINRSIPTPVASQLRSFQRVAAGHSHTCALTAQGDVYCWGNNTDGQLGVGSTSQKRVPTLVTF